MIQVMKAKSTVDTIDVMEPAEVKEEIEREAQENSMMDKDQTNSTRRRTLIPLIKLKAPPPRNKKLQLRKKRRRSRNNRRFRN